MTEVSPRLEKLNGKRIFCFGKFKGSSVNPDKNRTLVFRPIIDRNGRELRDHNWVIEYEIKTQRKIRINEWVKMSGQVIEYNGTELNKINGKYGEVPVTKYKIDDVIIIEIISNENHVINEFRRRKNLREHKQKKAIRTETLQRKEGGDSIIERAQEVLKNKENKEGQKARELESDINLKITLSQKHLELEYVFEKIAYGTININSAPYRKLLVDLYIKGFSKEEFKNIMTKLNVPLNKKLLFKLVKVAGRIFDFSAYCTIIGYFSSWNESFAKHFSQTSPRMFKNMLIGRPPSGKNYPIDSSDDLKNYLAKFNNIEGIKEVTLSKVLSIFLKDFKEDYMKYSDFKGTINIILKLIPKSESKGKILGKIAGLYFDKGYIKDGERINKKLF